MKFKPLEDCLAIPLRNGLTKPKKVRGQGYKMVNMGELFSTPIIDELEMDRVPLTEKEKVSLLEAGDLLFARQSLVREGAGQCSIFWNDAEEVCFESHIIRCRVNRQKADPLFLFYYFQSNLGKSNVDFYVEQGAGAAGIRGTDLLKVLVPDIDVEYQRKVAKTLYQLDRKIKNNFLVNQTLEQMAQAIFKSWFVDFDPVKAKMNGELPEGMDAATASLFPDKLVESELGLIPDGWCVNKLSDICKNHSQSYNLKSVDEVIFVNTGDVLEGDFLHNDYSPVEGLPGQAKKAIKEDDILYSEIRPKNKRYAYVDFDVSDYVVSTKFMVIQANEKIHPRLLYMILTRQSTIDEFNVIADSRSGTFPQITFNAISNLEFCTAPTEIQEAFVAQVMPFIKLQGSLKKENKQLAELRDTLLPKLLSGEIELSAEL